MARTLAEELAVEAKLEAKGSIASEKQTLTVDMVERVALDLAKGQ